MMESLSRRRLMLAMMPSCMQVWMTSCGFTSRWWASSATETNSLTRMRRGAYSTAMEGAYSCALGRAAAGLRRLLALLRLLLLDGFLLPRELRAHLLHHLLADRGHMALH